MNVSQGKITKLLLNKKSNSLKNVQYK
jgi:hypothetical protein